MIFFIFFKFFFFQKIRISWQVVVLRSFFGWQFVKLSFTCQYIESTFETLRSHQSNFCSHNNQIERVFRQGLDITFKIHGYYLTYFGLCPMTARLSNFQAYHTLQIKSTVKILAFECNCLSVHEKVWLMILITGTQQPAFHGKTFFTMLKFNVRARLHTTTPILVSIDLTCPLIKSFFEN